MSTNTDRPHFPPDMNNYEMPMMAFHNKKADGEMRTHNPNGVEDING